jgi:ATP-dependent DNA helicase RecQ
MGNESPRAILKKYFGFNEFYPYQKEIITEILHARDVLAVIATGGGKSLCYQVPALMLPGITLVISPLIALMKDQVDGLRENGVEAAFINSSMDFVERKNVEHAIREGRVRIVYISPEKMVQTAFHSLIQNVPLSLIAVDEAHCISQWGHEFRPEYRQLDILKRQFPRTPIIALTATATPIVQKDIIEQLHLSNPAIHIGSFRRCNLSYDVRPKKNAYSQVIQYLRSHRNESGIIYCASKKSVADIAKKLSSDGFPALPYHAGLSKGERSRTQELFVKDNVRIIVATVAFGMGIDKPDVRFVIHFDMPKSLEQYYQETGRAGRDGERSDCILFYSRGDMHKVRYFADQLSDGQERRSAYKKMQEMIRYCESHHCRVRMMLGYFGERLGEDTCGICDNCRVPKEFIEGTDIARRIMTCIDQLDTGYGAGYLADILCGAHTKKVRERGHTSIKAHGSGKEYSKDQWISFISQLIQLGYLDQTEDRYPVIRLTSQSRAVMAGEEDVILVLPRTIVETSARTTPSADVQLFQRLKRLRKEIADREGVPPYVIFSDASLRDIASRVPRTRTDLLLCKGIGEYKAAKYGDVILGEVFPPHGKGGGRIPSATSAAARPSLEKTRELYMQGLTIQEIAQRRDLAVTTVGSHLESLLFTTDEISLDDLVMPEKQECIRDAITAHGIESLKLLTEVLGDRYSINEIRLVRAQVMKERSATGDEDV